MGVETEMVLKSPCTSGKSLSRLEIESDCASPIEEIAKQFPSIPSSKVHHYILCRQRYCNDISKEEHDRIKAEKTKKSSITAGLETNQCRFAIKHQSSGLYMLKGKVFIVFCVKNIKQ